MISDTPELQVLPRDLSAYRQGNIGIDYVHRFDSGKAGPHVLVNALTHGNEFCGMTAVTHLLDTGVRPRLGSLTLSFANVAAYESFDPTQPFESRQLVHNLNRIWSPAWLDGAQDSPELRRARQLLPVVAAADHILDIHSTSQAVQPFWVYPQFERNGQAALAIGQPSVHLVMPQGLGSGTPLIQHGRHGTAEGQGVALVVECGQHFLRATGELAVQVALAFVAHFGLIALRLDVVFQLGDRGFVVGNDVVHDVADGNHAHHGAAVDHGQVANFLFTHQRHTSPGTGARGDADDVAGHDVGHRGVFGTAALQGNFAGVVAL